MIGILSSLFVSFLWTGTGIADGPALPVVALGYQGPTQINAGEIDVALILRNQRNGQSVSDQDLNIVHERKVHLFIFDLGLKEYFHEHPEFINGAWRLKVRIPVNGVYWIWAQGQLTTDAEDFSTSSVLKIVNGAPSNPLPSSLDPVAEGFDGNSGVRLSEIKFKSGHMSMPLLHFMRKDGSQPDVRPYLGAMAHVLMVSLDGDKLIHVHPMDHGGRLMLHTEFEIPGDYRAWIQFDDGGVIKTVPLAVRVE